MPTMTPALRRADTAPLRACDERLIDPELMFPVVDSERPGRPNAQERAAMAVCARCPVLAQCTEEVLEADMPYGVAALMTAADRRAVRAHRRGLPADSSVAPAVTKAETSTPAEVARGTAGGSVGSGRAGGEAVDGGTSSAFPQSDSGSPVVPSRPGLDLESEVHSVLAEQARFAHGGDAARVTALTTPRGPASASRWEVALAAVVALRLGRSVSATARHLGEQPTQVKRWQDRDQAGEALVRSPGGAGTSQLPRPRAATAASTSAASREQDRSAA